MYYTICHIPQYNDISHQLGGSKGGRLYRHMELFSVRMSKSCHFSSTMTTFVLHYFTWTIFLHCHTEKKHDVKNHTEKLILAVFWFFLVATYMRDTLPGSSSVPFGTPWRLDPPRDLFVVRGINVQNL